jgi:glycosyltransferase involved in cell wall biosynthesis
MRLPIALDYRPALWSGAGIGRATRELARGLAARDDLEVHLYGHGLRRADRGEPIPVRARLHRLPIPGRWLPFLGKLGLGADRLAGSAPVFHCTDYVPTPVSRARVVLTVHDLAFLRDPRWHGANAEVLRTRTMAAIAHAAAIVAPSHATAADVRTFAPAAPPVHVIPFGADHVVAPTNRTAGEHVLCLGTIEPRKNHLGLLAAWRLLPPPRPHLVVVGAIGWQCDAIVAALRAEEAAGTLTWHADANDARVWQLLANARLVVFPSSWEGFGFPPLEAMQLGVPAVVHDIAPMRELGDGVFAFTDASNPEALAAAIDRALRDDAWRSAATAAGRQRATTFRWDACAAAHAALYHDVASRRVQS